MKTSFITKHPHLACEWNYNKNINIDPQDHVSSSNLRVYWVCNIGHEWICSIRKRAEGNNCPICYQQAFAKKNPLIDCIDICAQWNYVKNNELSPDNFSKNSHKRVWWKCDRGHEWEATIISRTNGNGCPMCAGKKATKENCLATIFPQIANEWHNTKNGDLTPFDVTPSSGKKVWWKCQNGHEWKAVIYSRQSRGCSECQGFKIRNQDAIYNSDKSKKICKTCNKELDFSEYTAKPNKNGKIYYSPSCKKCEQLYLTNILSSELGIARDIVYRKKTTCKKENIPFDLTPEWVLYRLNEIDWKCELTGLPMRFNRNRSESERYEYCWDSISVDRIVPQNGYTKNNVRFILNQINTFKTDGNDDRMYMLAKALLDYRDNFYE
jgi:hypothetical protein